MLISKGNLKNHKENLKDVCGHLSKWLNQKVTITSSESLKETEVVKKKT